jgi:hypothetical protein
MGNGESGMGRWGDFQRQGERGTGGDGEKEQLPITNYQLPITNYPIRFCQFISSLLNFFNILQ